MKKLNVLAIGAHPDDCDFCFGGTALKYKAIGHRVMFLSITNGCSGHHLSPGPALVKRRQSETKAVSKMTGIECKIIDIPDGSLTTDLSYRDILMREIRLFKPDIIFTHRPNDYHPDHRSAGTLVMDCSYLVIVPYVVPDSPPLEKRPYIFYFYDRFTFPCPFVPDMVISINDVIDQKTAMLNCHSSQVYEFLPWAGGYSKEVPSDKDSAGRLQWLKTFLRNMEPPNSGKYRQILERRYGKERSNKIVDCEAFQLSEYGAYASPKELEKLFPL